jgi:DNA polymerase II small subunit/DNA polymerase delta subunit B
VLRYNRKIGRTRSSNDAGSMASRKEDEIAVVRKMLQLGYQVELGVVGKLLDQEGGPEPVLRILEKIMETKAKQRGRHFVIDPTDVKPFLHVNADLHMVEAIALDFKVIFDPTGNIDPTVDTSGYVDMFRSRIEKMSSIIRSRPDFFQIEKLNAIKTPNSGKKVLAKVVGLVVSKKVSSDYTSLTLEDDSGYLRLMCIDDAIRKV